MDAGANPTAQVPMAVRVRRRDEGTKAVDVSKKVLEVVNATGSHDQAPPVFEPLRDKLLVTPFFPRGAMSSISSRKGKPGFLARSMDAPVDHDARLRDLKRDGSVLRRRLAATSSACPSDPRCPRPDARAPAPMDLGTRRRPRPLQRRHGRRTRPRIRQHRHAGGLARRPVGAPPRGRFSCRPTPVIRPPRWPRPYAWLAVYRTSWVVNRRFSRASRSATRAAARLARLRPPANSR